MLQATLRESPTYNELFIDAINYGTAADIHPEEIVIEDVCAPWYNETYTTVQLPASASSKGTAPLHIKVNTGAGGNVLTTPHISTSLSKPDQPSWLAHWPGPHQHQAHSILNGSHIPLYGALHGPITWQAGCPGAQPHRVNSYWYVMRHTQSCHARSPLMHERLAVVKMNCAVTVM